MIIRNISISLQMARANLLIHAVITSRLSKNGVNIRSQERKLLRKMEGHTIFVHTIRTESLDIQKVSTFVLTAPTNMRNIWLVEKLINHFVLTNHLINLKRLLLQINNWL